MKNICIDNMDSQKIFNFKPIKMSRDKLFNVGDNAKRILVSKDGKEELIFINDKRILVAVLNELCPPTYYELLPTKIELPIKAVLMDLDGTSIISEEFWMELELLEIASFLLKLDSCFYHKMKNKVFGEDYGITNRQFEQLKLLYANKEID